MRARKLIIEVLIGLSVACAVLLPKLAPAQEPVVPGAFVAPAAAGQQQQWQQYSASNPLPVSVSSQFPSGSTPITGNATGTTGAVVGTLAAVTGKTTYVCGLNVSATGGTAAVGPITVAGTITGSLVFELNSSVAGSNLSENFSPCIPASAADTAITTTTTADGTASAVAVNSWGYQQ